MNELALPQASTFGPSMLWGLGTQLTVKATTPVGAWMFQKRAWEMAFNLLVSQWKKTK